MTHRDGICLECGSPIVEAETPWRGEKLVLDVAFGAPFVEPPGGTHAIVKLKDGTLLALDSVSGLDREHVVLHRLHRCPKPKKRAKPQPARPKRA